VPRSKVYTRRMLVALFSSQPAEFAYHSRIRRARRRIAVEICRSLRASFCHLQLIDIDSATSTHTAASHHQTDLSSRLRYMRKRAARVPTRSNCAGVEHQSEFNARKTGAPQRGDGRCGGGSTGCGVHCAKSTRWQRPGYRFCRGRAEQVVTAPAAL